MSDCETSYDDVVVSDNVIDIAIGMQCHCIGNDNVNVMPMDNAMAMSVMSITMSLTMVQICKKKIRRPK